MLKCVRFNLHWIKYGIFILFPILFSCEPLATGFDDIETVPVYQVKNTVTPSPPDSSVLVLTWNIRFGIGRLPWFGDACGKNSIFTREEIITRLDSVIDAINRINPDILLLQECDINSKRSAYINQFQYILDRTNFNYATYGYQWKAQFIPSNGLGRLEESNAIFSKWPITEAKRIQLDLREDQISIERFFYERCCMVTALIKIPGFKDLFTVNIHASAFSTDDTKHKHLISFKNELDRIESLGSLFVGGGDLNTLPLVSDSLDFCLEDACPDESFHQPGDDPTHKDGSNYAPEQEWMLPFYNTYESAVPLLKYQANQENYFSHTTRPEHLWDRKLDYLFTNSKWETNSDRTHQELLFHSDHAPVSARLILKKQLN